MTFDELQKTWQSQQDDPKLSIDSDLLLKVVQRNKQHFEWAILLRDVREVVISIAVFILFLHLGLKNSLWPFFLLARPKE
jgi:hypothetical protein